ncbi:TonB-dependent receptor [Dyadobacter jejuensis]|nr:TonB-dependent receptor [Dyadobacter jejuensis]
MTTTVALGQSITSTIRGTVRDVDTGYPIIGASVALAKTGQGTVTDENGHYRFENMAVGRYVLEVRSLGYETLQLPELLLVSGKELIRDVDLVHQATDLQEAVVRTQRPYPLSSVQEITTEQTLRYAATYLDPARVATSFAGVATANDQANGLVIRGNAPNHMQWRLEGVEIVNPNHLSNAGTFSDRATTTGGGVNILSTQLMGNSYFMNGAFPATYGNALSGVMDLRLRNGNNEKREYTVQAGLIGFDVAAEGPFSKNSKASYLINYRYSFTGLLSAMGVSFGGEDNRFQDLSFNLNFPTQKAGTFTVFGMGGISSNTFKADTDSTTWEFQKDGQNIYFKNKMGAVGITHSMPLNDRNAIKTAIVASGLTTTRDAAWVDPVQQTERYYENDGLSKSRVSLSSIWSSRLSTAVKLKAGGFVTLQDDRLDSKAPVGGGDPIDFQLKGLILQPFASINWQLAPRWSTELGLHYLYYSKSKEGSVEPRAAISYQMNPANQLRLSYGLQSQLPLPQTYLAGRSYGRTIGVSKSHQVVLAYTLQLPQSSSLKLEAYWQHLFDIPVNSQVPNSFSALNAMESVVAQPLANTGVGRNIGLEATWQKYLTDELYFIVAGSLYESTYQGSDQVWRSTRFDGRHTFSFTGGKEFATKTNRTWGVNLKALWIGGFRDTPIDAQASAISGQTVYLEDQAFSIKLKDYFRPDLRVYLKRSKVGYNSTWSLDLQNVMSVKNQAYSYYDSYQKRVVLRDQLGLIPVLSYRVQF